MSIRVSTIEGKWRRLGTKKLPDWQVQGECSESEFSSLGTKNRAAWLG